MSAKEFRDMLDSKAFIPTKKGIITNTCKADIQIQGKTIVLIYRNLPKVSLNKFYAGMHWKERNSLKNNYHKLINEIDVNFPIEVSYRVYFKNNPLDCSNFVGGMVKLIEDCLFPKNDGYKKVCLGGVRVFKGDEDRVEITIREIDKII